MKSLYRTMMFVFAAVVCLSGCSGDDDQSPVASDYQTDPQAVSGELMKWFDENVAVLPEEEPAGDPSVRHITTADIAQGNYDVYAVTFLWGQLSDWADPDVDTLDWTGSLSVNGVAIIDTRYIIDFEPDQDWVVPEDIEALAQWVSFTAADIDGLSFLVLLDRDVVYITPPQLTFETGPITLSFDFGQLVHMAQFYPIGSSSGVAVFARRVWQDDCPHGYMEGQWIKQPMDPSQGVFSGFWLDGAGEPMGYMNGLFWTADDNRQLFSGSVSGYETDQVIAELEGVWYYDDPRMCPLCGDDHGVFHGSFTYIADGSIGHLAGTFGDYNLPPDSDAMPYYGVWRIGCPSVAELLSLPVY